MSFQKSYTELARWYTLRHPLQSFVGIQITFWIFANFLLGIIAHLVSIVISEIYSLPRLTRFSNIMILVVIFGSLHGTITGFFYYYLDKGFSQKYSLGKVILLKAGISFVVLVIWVAITHYLIMPSALGIFINLVSLPQSHKLWWLQFSVLAIYHLFMSLLINFINQVNKKFGPGILLPLLMGKYRRPREEVRVFMFMDLNASTTIAEQLGHIAYSAFIRDSILNINAVVSSFGAEIYQYVGDEVVLTWPFHNEEDNDPRYLDFFFECENRFQSRKEYYLKNYGTVPSFKAGAHLGKVTAVEIGDIKREIAYHGDTMNTTSRILNMCNEYQKKILVSKTLLQSLNNNGRYWIEPLGKIKLRGKLQEVEIAGVQLNRYDN